MNEFFVIDSIMLVKVVMKMFVRLFVKFWMLLSDVMCVGVGVILLMSVYMLVLVNDRLVYVSVNRLRQVYMFLMNVDSVIDDDSSMLSMRQVLCVVVVFQLWWNRLFDMQLLSQLLGIVSSVGSMFQVLSDVSEKLCDCSRQFGNYVMKKQIVKFRQNRLIIIFYMVWQWNRLSYDIFGLLVVVVIIGVLCCVSSVLMVFGVIV